MRPQLLIACDFDGTVTRQDTLVEILNTFGSPAWHEIQKKVVSGELSIREGLEEELKTIRASQEDLQGVLKNRIELEPSFLPFYRKMQARGIPLILLTGGFDLCVETVLRKENLWPMPYLSNRLIPLNGARHHSEKVPGTGWAVEFPYPSVGCAACGHCKGDPISQWNAQGYTTLFVGNGVTDRCAALSASVTFAKDELGRWCASNGVAHVAYKTFNDIEKELKERAWL